MEQAFVNYLYQVMNHIENIEDQEMARAQLEQRGLVAFVR